MPGQIAASRKEKVDLLIILRKKRWHKEDNMNLQVKSLFNASNSLRMRL